jgi:hypothetical protein
MEKHKITVKIGFDLMKFKKTLETTRVSGLFFSRVWIIQLAYGSFTELPHL